MSGTDRTRILLARPDAWIEPAEKDGRYRLRLSADRRRRPAMTLDEAAFRELAREPGLAPLPDHARVEANKVPGCAAQVWLHVIRDAGRLFFLADSDSHLSKGNIALLLRLYSGRKPDEIVAFDARAAMDRLGLPQALTMQRANGLNAMIGRIRDEAARGA